MAEDIIVLLVDDSRIMRNKLKGIITEISPACGFLEADNGEDALAYLGKCHINLMLVDWNMPKLLGIDFLKQVKAIDQYKDVPVIMVTSESTKFHVLEALRSGASDYITKPINAELFKEKLQKLSFFGK